MVAMCFTKSSVNDDTGKEVININCSKHPDTLRLQHNNDMAFSEVCGRPKVGILYSCQAQDKCDCRL